MTRRLGSRSRSTAVTLGLGLVAAVLGVAVARVPVGAGLALVGGVFVVAAALDRRLLPLATQGDAS